MLGPFKYASIAKNISGAIMGYIAIKYAVENTAIVPQLQTIILSPNYPTTIFITNFGNFASTVIKNNLFGVTGVAIPNLSEIFPVLGAIAGYKIFSIL